MKQDEARLPVLFPYSSSGVVRVSTNTPCDCKALYGWGLDRIPPIPQVISSRCGWSSWKKRPELTERQLSQQLSIKWGTGWYKRVAKDPGIAFRPLPLRMSSHKQLSFSFRTYQKRNIVKNLRLFPNLVYPARPR